MSNKQLVKIHLINYFFGTEYDFVDASEFNIAYQVTIYRRELDNYISNSLNLASEPSVAISYLHPRLFSLLGTDIEQDISKYNSNPNDDSIVGKVLAYKMVIGD